MAIGAGEGNRTLVSGLGSPRSTIEPHPLRAPGSCSKGCLVAQLFDGSGASGGRILTLPPERRPPARRLCTSPDQKRRVGDRRSASRFPSWWQCQDAPASGCAAVRPCLLSFLNAPLARLKTAPFSRAARPAARWPHASPGSCASDRILGNKRKPPHCHKSCPA